MLKPTKVPAAPRAREGDDEPSGRMILAPSTNGPDQLAIMEWELRGEAWTDKHTHDEYNFVLEGRLFVEAGGVTVELGPGDTVCVPAGCEGNYRAPEYARMLGIYGPNPTGAPPESGKLERLDS